MGATDFEAALASRLGRAADQLQSEKQQIAEQMRVMEGRQRRFTEIADAVLAQLIRPRIEMLATHLLHGRRPQANLGTLLRETVVFPHSERFPANAELTMRVDHDGSFVSLIVSCDVQILPLFIKFKPHDEIQQPLDAVDQVKLAAWVELKLLEFTDTYLQLQVNEQYQQDNYVVDPVCGMRIKRSTAAAELVHEGRTYYFCVEACRDKFAENPLRFLGPVQNP